MSDKTDPRLEAVALSLVRKHGGRLSIDQAREIAALVVDALYPDLAVQQPMVPLRLVVTNE